MSEIYPVVMPKWGLSMEEGSIVEWHVKEGEPIEAGAELVDIETSKINNVLEAGASGVLRRIVCQPQETAPCGALIGVLAPEEAPDADIDAFINAFEENFDPLEEQSEGGAAQLINTADIAGMQIQYVEDGAGEETVVLIHGFGGDKDNWMFLQPELAKKHRTVAFDLPGHGGSSKRIGDIATVENMAALCARFVDTVAEGPVHLVGHSFGGAIAAAFALAQPERLRSLSLIAPAGLGPDINMDYIDGFIGASRSRDLRRVLSHLFADPALVSRDMIDQVVRYKRLDGVSEALTTIADKTFSEGRQVYSFAEQASSIRVPLLLLWGEEDNIIPARHARNAGSSTERLMIPGVGHMPHMEAAQAAAEGILAHIAAV